MARKSADKDPSPADTATMPPKQKTPDRPASPSTADPVDPPAANAAGGQASEGDGARPFGGAEDAQILKILNSVSSRGHCAILSSAIPSGTRSRGVFAEGSEAAWSAWATARREGADE